MQYEIYSVEDDSSIANLINITLTKQGYKVLSFSDGESFLKAFKEKKPDLALIDLMLPDMSGSEIIKTISEELNVRVHQIEAVLSLLEEGNTVPFIARYRKEKTGALDEDQIRTIDKYYQYQVNLLKRKEDEKPLETKITKKEISVTDRTKDIRNILRDKKKVSFFDLFEVKTREYVVVTFLSILEMAKFGEINIIQENNFDKIYCEAGVNL